MYGQIHGNIAMCIAMHFQQNDGEGWIQAQTFCKTTPQHVATNSFTPPFLLPQVF